MKSLQNIRITMILLIAFASSLLLAACNMPGRATPTRVGLAPISTFAAQTVQARLTQVSKPPATYEATIQFTITPQLTPEPGQTTTPGAPTSSPSCNKAKFVKDVSIPDNTGFAPSTHFVKTWRLENIGTCIWTPEYSLFFFQGDKMDAPDSVEFSKNVAPGETVDISVSMTAPGLPGAYKSEWKLRDSSNQVFGVGENANPVWTQILVVTESGLDFISRANSAYWRSGAPNREWVELTFGGAENDPNGAAKIVDNVTLENGRLSGKVLLMVPMHENQGWISGHYQPYLIQQGNHFEARVGFLANPDGTCGAGKVLFKLRYKVGDEITTLGEWSKSCNGSLLSVDLDLSRLAGESVQFILSVLADGSIQDDWAIWNSVQITK